MGGGRGGAIVGMKGPFSSTAGRTAATKARLDTLCPEPPLQLASTPKTLLILTSLSFPPLPGSHQGFGTGVGEENLSQQPEGSNSAEGQGQLLPSVQDLATFLKTREQWEDCGTAWCLPAPSPRGADKGKAQGGTEMQDRLHILEDLNMLYIRQMALSLEVMPLLLENIFPLLASQPQSALLIPAGAEWGRAWPALKWGGGQVVLFGLCWVQCVDPDPLLIRTSC